MALTELTAGDRFWINPAGGPFETTTNWNPQAVPTAADNAIFDLDSAYTVTFAGDADTLGVSVLTDDVTWDLGSHTYTLGDVTVLGEAADDAGHLTVVNGTVEGRTVSMGRTLGGEGSLTVSTGATWNHPLSTMVVGRNGAGALTVEDGGTVNSTSGEIARDNGATGQATVTGATSTWTIDNYLYVGQGGDGELTVSAGGSVSADSVTAGEDATGLAAIEVTGANSSLDVAQRLAVGGDGTGTLSVLAGGSVTADIADAGFATGGSGSITVNGADSTLAVDNLLQIGRDGQGQLTVSNGGTVTSAFKARLGVLEGSSGNATISGSGSTLVVADFFSVGSNGGGNLTISGGAHVTTPVSEIGKNAPATRTAPLTGARSTWHQTARVAL
ncbi:MAG: hypothetical protein KDA63_07040, partial [Planctomycetales bacterium]|nr:hypothetical protein [Planctomycetales bacterium]